MAWGRVRSAIVLAGGKSARMGTPKAMLQFGPTTMLNRVIGELGRGFREIVVVAARADVADFHLDLDGAVVVRDASAHPGPVAALRLGLETIRADAAFASSCDLPMLRADVALALAAMLDDADAVIPEVNGIAQPLHAVYAKTCVAELRAMEEEGDARLSDLAARINARVVTEEELRGLDADLISFLNINSPSDYERALELAGYSSSAR
jgi:molybdopterin-guanine dinucleotide biosynthesis protein A